LNPKPLVSVPNRNPVSRFREFRVVRVFERLDPSGDENDFEIVSEDADVDDEVHAEHFSIQGIRRKVRPNEAPWELLGMHDTAHEATQIANELGGVIDATFISPEQFISHISVLDDNPATLLNAALDLVIETLQGLGYQDGLDVWRAKMKPANVTPGSNLQLVENDITRLLQGRKVPKKPDYWKPAFGAWPEKNDRAEQLTALLRARRFFEGRQL
jgi:hypothetical protein